MKTVGVICEYNPLHLGHKKQLLAIRASMGDDCGIVCLMSGNYVQRGMPAIIDKSLRAKAAILAGADLVLEMPINYALSSAEGFAAGGVGILSGFCDHLSFGTETGNTDSLLHTAKALLHPDFSHALRAQLEKGLSFPAARQAALASMDTASDLLTRPNDILAVEYCKAILSQGSAMTPLPIARGGNYHATDIDPEDPSATAIRMLMADGGNWLSYIPEEAQDCFASAAVHALHFGERAVLARLRTMNDGEFEALPYGSEGLWRKLMHASRSEDTLEAILAATKSKRYTRTRLDRMVMCAFLGITAEDICSPAPYTRVLAFNDRGRQILKHARRHGEFINTGEAADHHFQNLERRADDLYGLFSQTPEPPGMDRKRRIYYHQ